MYGLVLPFTPPKNINNGLKFKSETIADKKSRGIVYTDIHKDQDTYELPTNFNPYQPYEVYVFRKKRYSKIKSAYVGLVNTENDCCPECIKNAKTGSIVYFRGKCPVHDKN